MADFTGSSNLTCGKMHRRDASGAAQVLLDGGSTVSAIWAPDVKPGSDVRVAVRPEHVRLATTQPANDDLNMLPGRITGRSYLGARYQYALEIGDSSLAAETEDASAPPEVIAAFDRAHAVVVLCLAHDACAQDLAEAAPLDRAGVGHWLLLALRGYLLVFHREIEAASTPIHI